MIRTKKWWLFSIFTITASTVSALAAVLPGVTYNFNNKKYIETNSDIVYNIDNNQFDPRYVTNENGTIGINNDYNTEPYFGYNESINYDRTWYPSDGSLKPHIYANTLSENKLSSLSTIESGISGFNLIGIQSSIFEKTQELLPPLPGSYENRFKTINRYPTSFITSKVDLNDETGLEDGYKLTFLNTALDKQETGDVSKFGGITKGDVYFEPKYLDYNDFAKNPSIIDAKNQSPYAFFAGEFYNYKHLKNNHKPNLVLSQSKEKPGVSNFKYYDLNNPAMIHFNNGYGFNDFEFDNNKITKVGAESDNVSKNNNTTVKTLKFADPLTKTPTTSVYDSMNAVSVSISNQWRMNRAYSFYGNKLQETKPVIFSKVTAAGDVNELISSEINIQPNIRMNDETENLLDNLTDKAIKQSSYGDVIYYGQNSSMSVTLAMTPVSQPNTASPDEVNNEHGFYNVIPMVYGGTTKIRTSAIVEPSDLSSTPFEYVSQGKYKRGYVDKVTGEIDNQADFNVNWIRNAYPGSQYGAKNTLTLNNTAGTVTWEYDPVTVLKDGRITFSTPEDKHTLKIRGFKRIPGITKIASSINSQSPFTVASDISKDSNKVRKIIYNLAIQNLPDLNDPAAGFGGNFNVDNPTDLAAVINLNNITFNNYGEATPEGYTDGGYFEADVSLNVYYDKHTNFIPYDPANLKPSPIQKIRVYGYKHIEPTTIPEEDIYVGDSSLAPSTVAEDEVLLRSYIISGMNTKVNPTAANNWRTTKGGTIPINDEIVDFSQKISIINPRADNIKGTISLTATLNAYYGGVDGALLSSGFAPVDIVIRGFKLINPTSINEVITIETNKTAAQAVANQLSYLKYLLIKNKDIVFNGLPDSFYVDSLQIIAPTTNLLKGEVTAQIEVNTYYDINGNLNNPLAGGSPSFIPLGTITIKGFKKVLPTKIKSGIVNISNDLELSANLASQVDNAKIASIIYQKRDEIFTDIPTSYFTVNSIIIDKVITNNLQNGYLIVNFSVTNYYDGNGEYIDSSSGTAEHLKFDGKTNPNLKIVGFTGAKATQFVLQNITNTFAPIISNPNNDSALASQSSKEEILAFLKGNDKIPSILGGDLTEVTIKKDENNKLVTNTDASNAAWAEINPIERSAWEILGLSQKTVYQINPYDIQEYILRVLKYSGIESTNIKISPENVLVKITSERDLYTEHLQVEGNEAYYEKKNAYTGSLTADITIFAVGGDINKKLTFEGTSQPSKNIFNRYIPLPIYKKQGSPEKNLVSEFKISDIEKFVYQNIDSILNGDVNNKASGIPINFSQWNMNISNVFQNNNTGEVRFLMTVDNFYLSSGNLSTDPTLADGMNPAKTISKEIVISGFKQQKSTLVKSEFDLNESGAKYPVSLPLPPDYVNFNSVMASTFLNDLKTNDTYNDRDFLNNLIRGKAATKNELGLTENNALLATHSQIPDSFQAKDIIGINTITNNVLGTITFNFNIINYFDKFGNLEKAVPLQLNTTIYGFQQVDESLIANTSISEQNIIDRKIYIKGNFDTMASVAGVEYIKENILSKTSGRWPGTLTDPTPTSSINLLDKFSNIEVVSASNSTGEVEVKFFVKEAFNFFDSSGNLSSWEMGSYTLIVSGFTNSMIIYLSIGIVIIFILFILIPLIAILIKKSKIKRMNRRELGSFYK